eukprot:scaffold13.g194.t1
MRAGREGLVAGPQPRHGTQQSSETTHWSSRELCDCLAGSGYRGLQVQQATAPQETIEDELEAAIFKAGGILESNMGRLSKLKWSRSSRTDKSVHSLSTVVACKLEVDPASFDGDPEGLLLAARINAHLPPEVRVFSVQRVSKSFDARLECVRRQYHYYLPASFLGLALDGGARDAATLGTLRAAWSLHSGFLPYHNYTKRGLYRARGRGAKRRGAGSAGEDGSSSVAEGEEADASEDEVEEDGRGAEPTRAGGSGASGTPAGAAAASGELAQQQQQQQQGVPRGKVSLRWYSSKEEAAACLDPVVRQHYRFMEEAEVSEVMELVPGGTPCVRHMVGAAVAAARGILPPELVEASLAAPARVALPLAPAPTLVLAACSFSPFRQGWAGTPAAITQWSGDRLALRAGGAAARDAFAQHLLLFAVDRLLSAPAWEEWEGDLARMWYDEGEAAQLLAAHAAWRREMLVRREGRASGGGGAGGALAEAAALGTAHEP